MCYISSFITFYLLVKQRQYSISFFQPTDQTPIEVFIAIQQSQSTVLFSSISCRKMSTAPSAPAKGSIHYSGKDEKPWTLFSHQHETKNWFPVDYESQYLRRSRGSFRWQEPQESMYCILTSLINSGEKLYFIQFRLAYLEWPKIPG